MTHVANREKTGKANENPATRDSSNSPYATVDPVSRVSTDSQASGLGSDRCGSEYFPQRRSS